MSWGTRKTNEIFRQRLRDTRARLKRTLGGCCMRCGNSDQRVLEFDHAEGSGAGAAHRKKFCRPRGGFKNQYYRLKYAESLARMEEEKPGSIRCLCANCHKIVHCEERGEFASPDPDIFF